VWLTLGVIAAAGTTSYEPLAGDSALAVAVAAVVALTLGLTACLAHGSGHRNAAKALIVTSLGASLVAARLAAGLALGPPGPPESTGFVPGSGSWTAHVESAHLANGQQIATITMTEPPVRCSVQAPAYPRLVAGDTVTWSGKMDALTDSPYDQYLAAQGIAASCRATTVGVSSHDNSPAGWLEAFRQTSGDALQRVLPEPEGGLAAAILIGLRDRVDKDLAAAFTTAGVSHIVAISGWNIAIVAATVATLLRGRFFTRRRRAIATILAIVAYTLFAGASASVLRAAVMAAAATLALETGRGSRVMVGLAWAVAGMVLVAPEVVADVGFQLSATATAGLVVWATPLSDWIANRAPYVPASIRESLGISLAAQAATLPIALLTFGRLALIAPAANLVAVPLVPPAMAAGALAFGAGWLDLAGLPAPLTGLLAMPAGLLLSMLVAVVRAAAAVPGANETLAFPANVVAAAFATGLLVLIHRGLKPTGRARGGGAAAHASRSAPGTSCPHLSLPHLPSLHLPHLGRWRWAVAGAVLLMAVAGSAVAARPDGRIHVIVLDVGQGDSILLEGDRGGRILVDGGPDPAVLMADLDRYIPLWDRHLDAVILTHPHDDHVGGLAAVIDRYSVGRAFESGWPADTAAYRAWKAALTAHGMSAERLSTGETLKLDDAQLRVLWPDDGTTRPDFLDQSATDNRKTNDASVVLLGEYENRRFLLTGDAEDDVDPILLSRGLPAVDMLKVAHHGSATASSDALLATLRPAVAVISVGAKNTYGHPNAATVARLTARSGRVLRTDRNGTVEVTLDRAEVTVETERSSTGMSGSGSGVASVVDGVAAVAAETAILAIHDADGTALLYDPFDVCPEPRPERGVDLVAPATGVASSPFASRGRDGGLACLAGGRSRTVGRSPPGRSSRPAA
jgi:competence protein ComEC